MLKSILKKIIIRILKIEARLILWRYKPKIIAISGTVGKTTTKEAIYNVMATEFSVRKSEKSYNSEIGVPLAIIGAPTGWNSVSAWGSVIIKGLKVLAAAKDYPQWLIIETGVDRPGDMSNIVSWLKPDVAVVTAIGAVPVHVENFPDIHSLINEKAKLVQSLSKDKYAILNGDDKNVFDFRRRTRANIITYGFSPHMDVAASNYKISAEGVSFKVSYKGNIVPVRLSNIYGEHNVYAVLAALAVGISQELNFVKIAEAVSKLRPLPGRLALLEGVKNTLIFDDTYNSSPIALEAALEAVSQFPAKRKVAVLGDMLELGKFSADEHRRAGKLVFDKNIDLLLTVGTRSKLTAEEARMRGFNDDNISEFSNSEEAGAALLQKIKEGDLILVKGSQSLRMEKAVEKIMAKPELKKELLARQEAEWQNR